MPHGHAPIDSVKKNFADKTGKTQKKEDELWKKAEKLSAEAGHEKGTDEFYRYAMGIFKKMNGISEGIDESKGAKKKKDRIRWNPVRGFFPVYQSFDSSETPSFQGSPSIISEVNGLID